jgi:hypothetical protein
VDIVLLDIGFIYINVAFGAKLGVGCRINEAPTGILSASQCIFTKGVLWRCIVWVWFVRTELMLKMIIYVCAGACIYKLGFIKWIGQIIIKAPYTICVKCICTKMHYAFWQAKSTIKRKEYANGYTYQT